MREEPVLYVNGQPYVLREAERPFKNLQEYRGIGAERLELMEQRLKEDVLREAEAFHGRVLVSREEPLPGSTMTVVTEVHEVVQGPAAVMTAREMAIALVAEGYLLTYHRVPLTDDMAPRASDFDAFYKVLRHADPDAPIVFNCQMGVGRTTTGMVVACMLRNHLHGVPLTGRLLRSFSEAEPAEGDALDGLSPRMVSGGPAVGCMLREGGCIVAGVVYGCVRCMAVPRWLCVVFWNNKCCASHCMWWFNGE